MKWSGTSFTFAQMSMIHKTEDSTTFIKEPNVVDDCQSSCKGSSYSPTTAAAPLCTRKDPYCIIWILQIVTLVQLAFDGR